MLSAGTEINSSGCHEDNPGLRPADTRLFRVVPSRRSVSTVRRIPLEFSSGNGLRPKETTMAKSMTFIACMKDYFGLRAGTSSLQFMQEIKALSPSDRKYFADGLNKAGYEVQGMDTAAA